MTLTRATSERRQPSNRGSRGVSHDQRFRGATAIEYGLIAALIAVVCITVWTNIGTSLSAKFEAINTGLK